jgi:hypothetical protein
MQIIKLLSIDTFPFFNNFEGIEFELPNEKDSLDNFELPEVTNECIYIIEAAPDTSNPLNYDGVNIALKIYFQAIANNINSFRIVLIDFEIESREYNSKWYTDIKAWKIEVAGTSTQNTPDITVKTDDFVSNVEDDILPF